MVFQGYALFPHLSVFENVAFGLRRKRVGDDAIRSRVGEMLELVELPGYERRKPAELSGGQQQRVAVARAIVTAPHVLFADEPTGNLDTARSREIMELLTALNRDRGITIVMVTHEPDMAAYAKRVVRFVDGRVESDERNDKRAA